MLEYVHLLPGRMRLKISQLRHPRKAAEAQAHVSAISGVRRVIANPVTGSLVINFERDKLSVLALWERLQEQGYISRSCPEPTALGVAPVADPGAIRMGRFVMQAFVEAVVQHSARALVRTFL